MVIEALLNAAYLDPLKHRAATEIPQIYPVIFGKSQWNIALEIGRKKP